MRTGLASALLAALVLAGCFAGDEGPVDIRGGHGKDQPPQIDYGDGRPDYTGSGGDGGEEGGEGGEGGAGEEGGEGAEEDNSAPSGSLTAEYTPDAIPVDVRFHIEATDADGDDFTWRLDADDDGVPDLSGRGSGLPADYVFTYSYEGIYEARLTMNDTEVEVATTLEVDTNVVETEGAAQKVVVVMSRHLEVACNACLFFASDGCTVRSVEAEADCAFFDVSNPRFSNSTFRVESDALATGFLGPDPDLEFVDSCYGPGAYYGVFANSGPESGQVPAGAGCLIAWEFSPEATDITITAAFTNFDPTRQ